MATRKQKRAPGANIEEWQRGKEQIKLRLTTEEIEQLKAKAATRGLDMSRYVARLVADDA